MTNTTLATVDDKVLNDYLETLGIAKTLPVEQKKMFLQIAKANNLNPFKKEIYAIPYKWRDGKTTLSIITGYQTYISRANASWKLNWWKAETIRDDKWEIIWAKVIIYRKDWKEPFVWEISRKDFDKWTSTWKTMPDFMTKKVAIAQAFRLAFPDELGWMPYTQEEMEGVQPVQQEAQVIEPEVVEEPRKITDAQLKKIKAEYNNLIKLMNITDKQAKEELYKDYLKMVNDKVESTKDLTLDQASKMIELLINERERIEKELETEKLEAETEEEEEKAKVVNNEVPF